MFQGGDKCFRDCRNKKKYRISIPILKLKHYIHVLNKHTHIPGGTHTHSRWDGEGGGDQNLLLLVAFQYGKNSCKL